MKRGLVLVMMLAWAGRAQADYCSAWGGCDEHIDSVHFYLTHNKGTGCMGYDARLGGTMELQRGQSYALLVKNAVSYFGDQCYSWIDWDHDEVFESGSETYILSSSFEHFYTTVTVPADAALGKTRLRIRLSYTGGMSPCDSTKYGEVEDYEFYVVQESQSQVIFESATMGAMNQSTGYSFSDTEFRGVRFEVTEATQITAVGAHLVQIEEYADYGVIDFYICQLSGPTGFPTYTLFPAKGLTGWFPPESSMDFRLRVQMPVLQPGWYALVVRYDEDFGGIGLLPSTGQNTIGSPSYIRRDTSGWVNVYHLGFSAPRFVIEGYSLCGAPNAAENPIPWDGLRGVSSAPSLQWTEDNDLPCETSYDVYLDSVNPPAAQIAAGLTEPNFPVSGLDPNTTYYWQVIAATATQQTAGPVWSFTTEDGHPLPPPPKYHIIDLGVYEEVYYYDLPMSSSRAWALNEAGCAVGTAEHTMTGIHDLTFFWHDENGNGMGDPNELRRAEDLVASGFNTAYDISNTGLVVGTVGATYALREAFYWLDENGNRIVDPGESGELTRPPDFVVNLPNYAKGCNDNFKAAGAVAVAEGYNRAVMWDVPANTYTLLGTLGGSESFAESINNLNHVVGYADCTGDSISRGFVWVDGNADGLWQETEVLEVGTFGGDISRLYDINNKGHAVGGAQNAVGRVQALYWSDQNENGRFESGELTQITDAYGAYATALNDRDQVVGYAAPVNMVGSENAFYWDPYNGRVNLFDLVCNRQGWRRLQYAYDINNKGWIAGAGAAANGGLHAFVMIPAYEISDLNCDGAINLTDLADLSRQWETSKTQTDLMPCGGDGTTNLADFAKFAKTWTGDYPLYPYDIQTDFNLDGLIDAADLSIFADHFLQPNLYNADISPWPAPDGKVDLEDLVMLAGQWLLTE